MKLMLKRSVDVIDDDKNEDLRWDFLLQLRKITVKKITRQETEIKPDE